jgi:hypothetical protein
LTCGSGFVEEMVDDHDPNADSDDHYDDDDDDFALEDEHGRSVSKSGSFAEDVKKCFNITRDPA